MYYSEKGTPNFYKITHICTCPTFSLPDNYGSRDDLQARKAWVASLGCKTCYDKHFKNYVEILNIINRLFADIENGLKAEVLNYDDIYFVGQFLKTIRLSQPYSGQRFSESVASTTYIIETVFQKMAGFGVKANKSNIWNYASLIGQIPYIEKVAEDSLDEYQTRAIVVLDTIDLFVKSLEIIIKADIPPKAIYMPSKEPEEITMEMVEAKLGSNRSFYNDIAELNI